MFRRYLAYCPTLCLLQLAGASLFLRQNKREVDEILASNTQAAQAALRALAAAQAAAPAAAPLLERVGAPPGSAGGGGAAAAAGWRGPRGQRHRRSRSRSRSPRRGRDGQRSPRDASPCRSRSTASRGGQRSPRSHSLRRSRSRSRSRSPQRGRDGQRSPRDASPSRSRSRITASHGGEGPFWDSVWQLEWDCCQLLRDAGNPLTLQELLEQLVESGAAWPEYLGGPQSTRKGKGGRCCGDCTCTAANVAHACGMPLACSTPCRVPLGVRECFHAPVCRCPV